MQPYKFPQVLTDIGAYGVPGEPVKDLPFYRLTGASVRRGVSALMAITMLDLAGQPAPGVKLVNIFPDGNGEILTTDSQGTARLQFGASSAFSVAGRGPFHVWPVDDATKDDGPPKVVTVKNKIGDGALSLGDWQAEHTEIYLQYRQQRVPTNINTLEDAIRDAAYSLVGAGAVWNPGAALQNTARQRGLKAVLTDEFSIAWNNEEFICQGFVEAILYTKVGFFRPTDFLTLIW